MRGVTARAALLGALACAGCGEEAAALDLGGAGVDLAPAGDLPAGDLAEPCPLFAMGGNLLLAADSTFDDTSAWSADAGPLATGTHACRGGDARACVATDADGGASTVTIHRDRFFQPKVDQQYHGELWVKLDRATDVASLSVRLMLPTDAFLNAQGTTTTATTAWQRLTVDFRVVSLPTTGDVTPSMSVDLERSADPDAPSCIELDQAYFGEAS